jgi:hypothetical protein
VSAPEAEAGAAANPVLGNGAPTHGGLFWAAGADGTAGKLRPTVAGAVIVIGTVVPEPVKPVYSVPLAVPDKTLNVPPVVVAGTLKE